MRVVVAGARGRMGRVVVPALRSAPGVTQVSTLDRGDDVDAALERDRPQVLVDFTHAQASAVLVAAAVQRDISPVIGTSGWAAAAIADLARLCAERGLGALLIPNFSIGAVLQMRFAAQAARLLACSRLREVHHSDKRDSPSGTSLATAAAIEAVGGRPPAIESERREGLVAEQELRFEGPGEALELRHHVDDRRAYVAGVLLAVSRVRALDRLIIGLDPLLEDAGC